MKKSVLSAAASLAALMFPHVSQANYPDKVEAEKASYKTVSLESGSDLNVISRWLQPTEWQDEASAYDAFAVSGQYFYIADRSNTYIPKLLRFDNSTGLFVDEIEVGFGEFPRTTFGHLGCDDFGNLYISSACSTDGNKLKYNDIRWTYDMPSNDTISVIDLNGKVTRQWIASAPGVNEEWESNLKLLDRFFFDHITIRGNVETGEGMLVAIPVGAARNGYGTGWSPNYYTVQGGSLKYVDFTGPNLADKMQQSTFSKQKLATPSLEPYFSIYPLEWQDKMFEQHTGFPAVAVVGFPEKEPGRFVFATCDGGQYGHPYALPEECSGCSGAINMEYGTDTIMAIPYIDGNSGEIRISISQPFFSCSESHVRDIRDKHIESSATQLVTVPQDGSLKGRTDIGMHMACIQAVDNTTNPAAPTVDLYFYAPGRAIGKYTLSQNVIQTSVEAVGADTVSVVISGRTMEVSGACEVTVYDLTGQLLQKRHFAEAGTLDLTGFIPGAYIVKYGADAIKIIL